MSEKPSGALVWVHDPQAPHVVEAVNARSCDLCGARKGELCRNTIRPNDPIPGRVVHFARLFDRNARKGAEDG